MMSSIKLQDKTVLITGACQGVGLRVAEILAKAGMSIIGVDCQEEKLVEAMERLSAEYKVESLARAADVRMESAVKDAVAAAVERFGQIDVLVNNAGIRKVAPVWETSTALWDEILAVNLRGQFLVTREVLNQAMLNQDRGKIVLISSIAGLRGSKNSAAYCASKWGIRGLAHALAQDLKGREINVTVITPGRTDTPMARNSEQWNPDIGWLDTDAIGQAILFFIQQDYSVEVPEIHLHHKAEL